jgi:hypothetical protein
MAGVIPEIEFDIDIDIGDNLKYYLRIKFDIYPF